MMASNDIRRGSGAVDLNGAGPTDPATVDPRWRPFMDQLYPGWELDPEESK